MARTVHKPKSRPFQLLPSYHLLIFHTVVNNFLLLQDIKQLLDEVEHDIMNYQSRGLCYLPQPSASANNTDTRV